MAKLKLKKTDDIIDFPDEKFSDVFLAFEKWVNTKEDTLFKFPEIIIRASDIDKLFSLAESCAIARAEKLAKDKERETARQNAPLTDEQRERTKEIREEITSHLKGLKMPEVLKEDEIIPEQIPF